MSFAWAPNHPPTPVNLSTRRKMKIFRGISICPSLLLLLVIIYMRIWKRYRRQPWNATRSQDIVIMFLFFWMKKVVPQIMLWISIDLFCGKYHVFFDSKEGHQMMSWLEAQKNVDQFVLELFSEWVIYLSEIIIHCYDNPIGCCFIRWFRYNNTTTLSPPILDGILSICWSGVIPLQAGVTGVWLSFCQSAMTYILRVRRA